MIQIKIHNRKKQSQMGMYKIYIKLDFYSRENAKFILILFMLVMLVRYLHQKKILQKISDVLIKIKNLHENEIQQIPEDDNAFKKNSFVKFMKKKLKQIKNMFKKEGENQIDISKKYSQFDMEESI